MKSAIRCKFIIISIDFWYFFPLFKFIRFLLFNIMRKMTEKEVATFTKYGKRSNSNEIVHDGQWSMVITYKFICCSNKITMSGNTVDVMSNINFVRLHFIISIEDLCQKNLKLFLYKLL